MGYDIDTIGIVSGELRSAPSRLLSFYRRIVSAGRTSDLPCDAIAFFRDPLNVTDRRVLTRVPWTDEGSGYSEPLLREFLSCFDGDATLLLCWEGGRDYSGLIVKDGVVTEGRVVQTVVPKEVA